MSHIYRPKYTKNGKQCESKHWHVVFRDHQRYTRRIVAFESKSASEEMLRNLDKLVAYHVGTGGDTDPKLAAWLIGLPKKTTDRLMKWGLLDRVRVSAVKPLAKHLEDFNAALVAKGATPKHVYQVVQRARRLLIECCGFQRLSDIDGDKLMEQLDVMRQDTTIQNGDGVEVRRGISNQTFNFYLNSAKQFCRWLVKAKRMVSSPIVDLDGRNVKEDRRHDRRALTVDELVRLLNAAQNGPKYFNMTGPERAMLYRLAVETGLRRGELGSLTRTSFDLASDGPTVTVEAQHSKRRRKDTLPLRNALAQELAAFLATKMPGVRVFDVPKEGGSSIMIRRDLEAAGIPYQDENGLFADFHCLRHTFITNLVLGGVNPKVAQGLARHSTITLTMDRYTHLLMEEQSTALEVLPDLEQARGEMQKTGTDDGQISCAQGCGHNGYSKGARVTASAPKAPKSKSTKTAENIDKSRVFKEKTVSRRGGRVADRIGLESGIETDASSCQYDTSDSEKKQLAQKFGGQPVAQGCVMVPNDSELPEPCKPRIDGSKVARLAKVLAGMPESDQEPILASLTADMREAVEALLAVIADDGTGY